MSKEKRNNNESYRSENAQDLHTKILIYIEGGEEHILRLIKRRHAASQDSYLREVSSSGFSFLHDAIHLSAELQLCSDKTKAAARARNLFDALMQTPDQTKAFLLTHRNNEGYSALYDACRLGDQVLVEAYFKELKALYKKNIITQASLITLVTSTTKAGDTLMRSVLKSGNTALSIYFLNVITTYSRDNPEVLNGNDYVKLLIDPNKDNITPLHEIIDLDDPNQTMMLNYFSAITQCRETNMLTENKLIQMLKTTTPNRFMLTHDLVKSDNPQKIKVFLQQTRFLVRQKLLDKAVLHTLMTSATDLGFTPLHDTAKSKHPETVGIYIDQFRR